eukprot:TRINITY_DN1303_c0_g1_i3.p1 TRINITY_DN1303_c0_g1~~TRINITY_DN1303_c0_g1_i3.p1  ORF type:complete len:346 (+),score=43.22 TRINITY_DN1303_c0_g1_i3:74-1111(+)
MAEPSSKLQNDVVRIGGIGIASLVVMIEAARECDRGSSCDGYKGWAVACSVISLAVAMGIGAAFKLGTYPEQYHPGSAVFFTIWWGVGTGCMTFKEPFPIPGNAYFAAWGALIISVNLCMRLVPKIAEQAGKVAGKRDICWTLMASIVVFIQALSCSGSNCGAKEWVWVFVFICQCVAIVLCLLSLFLSDKIPAQPFAIVLICVCTFGWILGTFGGPFAIVGNGYIGLTVSFIASLRHAAVVFGFYHVFENARLYGPSLGGDDAPAATAPPPQNYSTHSPPVSVPVEKKSDPVIVPPTPPPPAPSAPASDQQQRALPAASAGSVSETAEGLFWKSYQHGAPGTSC